VYVFIIATCFGLTVGHHQAIQIVQNIKGIHKNTLSESRSLLQCVYHVHDRYGIYKNSSSNS